MFELQYDYISYVKLLKSFQKIPKTMEIDISILT